MRATASVAALALALVSAIPAHAQGSMRTAPFQLQADGVFQSISGTAHGANDERLQDRLDSGGGFAITSSIGVRPHVALAARVHYFSSTGAGSLTFRDIVQAGPFHEDRRLRTTNVHGLLQYRHGAGRFQWQVEAGAGVQSARYRLVLTSATGEKASAVGVQLDPSFAGGLQMGWLAGWNSDFVVAGRWIGVASGDGAVWSKGDSPRFLTWSLGVRYPHGTH